MRHAGTSDQAPIAVIQVLLNGRYSDQQRAYRIVPGRTVSPIALCYVRLGRGASESCDQEYPLDDMKSAIRKVCRTVDQRKLGHMPRRNGYLRFSQMKNGMFIIGSFCRTPVKYTVSGNVTITVDREKKKQLSISDTGISISPEDFSRIFEKGYTGYNGRLDKKSTGIGLYLCRTAADKLGHKLTAQSTVGKGSSFTIDLSSIKQKLNKT